MFTWNRLFGALACMTVVASTVSAQIHQTRGGHRMYEPPCYPPGTVLPAPSTTFPYPHYPPSYPGTPVQPGQPQPGQPQPGQPQPGQPQPGQPQPGQAEAPTQPTFTPDQFAAQTERGGEAAPSMNPGMFGDLIGFAGSRVVFIPEGVSVSAGVQVLGDGLARVVAPIPYGAAYKIVENESPRPTNRIYFNYNYYNNVTQNIGGLGFAGVPDGDLHREMIGFERTFLNGDASFGLRLPFQQLVGSSGLDDSTISDLSLIFKYAWINDRVTGDVLSSGLVLTLPTGEEGIDIPGQSELHPTFIQPWVGFIKNFDNFYLQGFSSILVPTDARDVTVLFNSLAAGWFAYRADQGCDSCWSGAPEPILRGIVPVAEVHVSTPLNHRGLDNIPIGYSDVVNLTGGVHFLFSRCTIGTAFGVPLTGPSPYDFEVAANINFCW